MKILPIKTIAILCGAVLFLSVLAAGCGGGSGGSTLPAATAPRVLSLAPADGTSGMATATTMVASFDMPMDMNSVNTRFHVYEGSPDNGSIVNGTFSWNAAHTAMTFTPDAPLTSAATHTIHFSAGMMGAADGHMMSRGSHVMNTDTMTVFITQ